MSEYQQRVVTEKKELDEKIVKLTAFVFSDKIKAVSTEQEKDLLRRQLKVMVQYSVVLDCRIALFHDGQAS